MTEDELLDEARRLRAQGKGWKTISHMLGHSDDYYMMRLVPGHRERRRERERLRRIREAAANAPLQQQRRVPALSAEQRKEVKSLRSAGYRAQAIASILRAPYKAVEAALEAK